MRIRFATLGFALLLLAAGAAPARAGDGHDEWRGRLTCPDPCPPAPDCALACPLPPRSDERIIRERCRLVRPAKDPGAWEVCTLRVKRPARTR